jgi:signal transduction histidine kinase
MTSSSMPNPVLDGEFVAALLHKLSQPLAAMRGSLEMALLFGRSIEDYRAAVEEAIEQVDRMTRMKRTIGDLTSGEDLGAEAELSSMLTLILGAAEAVQADAEQSSVDLNTICSEALQARVNTRRFTQALVSFLSIALGYSPRGSQLQICCLRNGEQLSLGISNTDGAIPQQDLPRLFDAFVELSARGGESGASLALARRIIEAAGGTVRPENSVGSGFRLNIRLPVANASCSSAA